MHTSLRLPGPEEAIRKIHLYQYISGVIYVPQKHTPAKQQAHKVIHCHLKSPLENQPGNRENGFQKWTL